MAIHVGLTRVLVAAAVALGTAASAQAMTVVPFSYTGAEQQFTVPANVSSIQVVAVGAPGGASLDFGYGPGAGGLGGTATADLAVTANETLYIEVGGAGSAGTAATPGAGGFNGGGASLPGARYGGGGGGASDVRTMSSGGDAQASLVSRLIVAGGGGGGGPQSAATGGAGGGLTGGTGDPDMSGISGGGGGTQTEGGAVGTPTGSTPPAPGQFGSGGTGGGSPSSSDGAGGGGGGGGWYGGAGGGMLLGGGGGSGYFGAGTTNTSFGTDTTGTPSVTISYTVNPAVSLTGPSSGATYTQNQVVDAAYGCTAAAGTTLSSCTGSVASGTAIDTGTLGAHTFTVTAADADGGSARYTVAYTVLAPPAISIVSPAAGATFAKGQVVDAAYTCTAATGTTITACSAAVANGAALDTGSTGPHTLTVTATDALGGTTTRSVTYNVSTSSGGGTGGGNGSGGPGAPTLTGLRESAKKWREHGPRRARHKPPLGTKFTFELNQTAKVTFTFSRLGKHHRIKIAGELTVTARAGHDTVTFNGRILHGRLLRPGAYQVSVTASDPNGHVVVGKRLKFTIVVQR